ncbi:metallo-beta-lactamase family protein [Clostridium tetanomorphum]|uniref:MBL fold metallo-hydrolase n=1 Tax=Clostridium tetanomorphum TaxID=1553 RepID=A0A923E9G3_CLOTT|nr:MBL fold metallo-hydrolase [Clostridium tetanomorphum]KAJ53509.1 metallo-beta-lactamase family protein [Clostridium tetanomorphum DSM 665]MBC2396884.1 MBL fold metallo-hydrolase [Clostridium tetanomorphum]MBP1863153.1 metallo-beta-lactamase family protein [Clostridium tetanomorphum]NRS84261.1 metallo-beta-lactamase family protein [Clostridium tetanomorphum]NRZ97475.1 metallo-beta-lactamase family protein [Clostridium tetanomorphum]
MVKIEFFGAAGCVTGSSHLLKVKDKKILLDCGLYQGKDEKERGNETFNFNPKDIDYVVLSHAHIDHSGRIPLLYKQGFKGDIICTEGTKDLCNIMLEDSGHIQEMEIQWINRKRMRLGQPPIEPLYTVKIAQLSSYLFTGYPYNQWIELFDGFKVRFRDAGHLLGSSIVEMLIREDEKEIKLVYSGDLGNKLVPLLKDPTNIDYADYVIMETTYGNRVHENLNDNLRELVNIIKSTFKRGGNVIIPSFAVGRTQEVLYALNHYVENGLLKDLKVYVDSPLAAESTSIFNKYTKYYDEEATKLVENGDNPLAFEGLTFTKSPEESMKVNKIHSGALVISASGMCEAGRIKHHLKHNLWRKESSIVFVGYQAEGTLGRAILDGAKKVKIFGEEIAVNAKIYNLQGLSGHADKNGLIEWIENFKTKPKGILLVHGEEDAQNSFKELLDNKGYNSIIMQAGNTFVPGDEVKEKSIVKDKILTLLDSLTDIDKIDKNLLLDKIKESIE